MRSQTRLVLLQMLAFAAVGGGDLRAQDVEVPVDVDGKIPFVTARLERYLAWYGRWLRNEHPEVTSGGG